MPWAKQTMFGLTTLPVPNVTLLTVVAVPLIKNVADEVPDPTELTRISRRANVFAAIATPLAVHVAVAPVA